MACVDLTASERAEVVCCEGVGIWESQGVVDLLTAEAAGMSLGSKESGSLAMLPSIASCFRALALISYALAWGAA